MSYKQHGLNDGDDTQSPDDILSLTAMFGHSGELSQEFAPAPVELTSKPFASFPTASDLPAAAG